MNKDQGIIDAIFANLLNNSWVIILAVAALAVLILLSLLSPKKRRKSRMNSDSVTDPRVQLDSVSKVAFIKQKLLNKEEYPILLILEQIAAEANKGLRVMSQVNMGEVLKVDPTSANAEMRDKAFRSINSKRLDFAVFDTQGLLVLAVEYQGTGHYQGNSDLRDAVKREVLNKAGVPLIEIAAKYKRDELEKRLRESLVH